MSKNTPGPWDVCGNGRAIQNVSDPIFWKVGIKKGGIRIAEAHATGGEETEANARLISAAPDLLEAANMALYVLSDTDATEEDRDKAIEMLECSINKAEGNE